ncbi:MAG: type II secretion system F family protein [Planctomycetota bacterium]|nr:type II secretion system F family protein [Planctomycetota bacterium]
MPTFRYDANGSSGSSQATLEAPDRASAIRELLARGVTPTSLQELSLAPRRDAATTLRAPAGAGAASSLHSPATPSATKGLWRARVMTKAETAVFIRELSIALQAGLPLVQAMRTIARQGRSAAQRALLLRMIDGVEHGKALADALSAEHAQFPDLTVNLVRAGEASGKLPEVLSQAADLLDREVKLRRSLLSATLYPLILAGLVAIAVTVVVTVIVPSTLSAVKGASITLPWPTRVVQGFASFMGSWWWAVALGSGGLALLASRVLSRPNVRLVVDAYMLRAPLLGRLQRDVAVARFTRTLGTLVASGIPAVPALRVTKGTLGNKAMERVVDEVCEQVTAGKTIADPMERSGYFPPMLVQIINLGERSGRLDQLLNQAAGAFEEKTETSIKLFTTALPPVLVVGLACVVGFVVLAILLPLLEMQDAIPR